MVITFAGAFYGKLQLIVCIWMQKSSAALTALAAAAGLYTVEPLLTVAAQSRVVSTSTAIYFITNWWMSKIYKWGEA